jgi:putative adenylate-forming enzyme
VRFQYFDLKTEMAEHIKNLHAFQPTSLFAPASMLLKIAKAIRTGELKLTALERVLTGAEALDPVDAANLREVFKEPIMNIYQCTEGFLAVGCSLGSIHLNEDMLIIEKDYLDAEKKRFCPIITDLRRITQPYVRYRMNDVLLESSEACACGSVLQKIESITGRENDLIRLDGTQILFHDEISTIFLKHRSLFSEYQLVQTGANELSLSLRDEKPTAREKIESDLRALIASKKYSAVEIKNVSYQAPLPWIKLRRIRNEFTVPLNVVG